MGQVKMKKEDYAAAVEVLRGSRKPQDDEKGGGSS